MSLIVKSRHAKAPSKRVAAELWESFMKNGSTHSGMARHLPYLMNRAESEGVPYVLTGHPRKGYSIKKLEVGDG